MIFSASHARMLLAALVALSPAAFAGDRDLDPRFGPNGNGRLVVDIDTDASDFAVQVVPAKDGALYVVGRTSPGIGIIRLTTDGLVDPDFPIVSYSPDPASYWLFPSAAVQATNGDLILAGHYYDVQQQQPEGPFWIACRFDADGVPVESFGDGEIAPGCTDKFGAGNRLKGEARDLTMHPAGRVVFAGHIVDQAEKRRAALSSLDATGDPAQGFDDGVGEVNLVVPHPNVVPESTFNAVTLGPNGTLLSAGDYILSDTDSDVLVTMHLQSGEPFQPFGANGSAIHALNLGPVGARRDSASAIVLTSGGELAVAGTAEFSVGRDTGGFVLWIKPNGGLNTSLGNNGRTVFQEDGMDLKLYDIERTPKGDVMVGGSVASVEVPNFKLAAVLRLDATGEMDPIFSLVAFQFSDTAGNPDKANKSEIMDLAVQGDRIVAAGYRISPANDQHSDTGVARLGDGRLFGDGFELIGP